MSAEVAQLIEYLPSKQAVAGLSPVFRSILKVPIRGFFLFGRQDYVPFLHWLFRYTNFAFYITENVTFSHVFLLANGVLAPF